MAPTFQVKLGTSSTQGYHIHVIDDNTSGQYIRSWDWGDGTTSNSNGLSGWAPQTHLYTTTGIYNVTLTTGSPGITSSPVPITVGPQPEITSKLDVSFLGDNTYRLSSTVGNATNFSINPGFIELEGEQEFDLNGPGDESWRSNKFRVKNSRGENLFVYGYERSIAPALTGQMWDANQTSDVEQSWVRVGSTTFTHFTVSLVSGNITDVVVYPKNICSVSISEGKARITVPYNKRVRVEINGDKAEALHLFNNKPKSSLGSNFTSWPTLVKDATPTISGGNPTVFKWDIPEIGTTYGVGNQFRALLTATTMPTILAGKVRDYEILTAEVTSTSPKAVKLIDHDGTEVEISSDGIGHKLSLVDYKDTDKTLYFGPGVHKIGRAFRLANDIDVYFDTGAVVYGTFDGRLRNEDGSLNDPEVEGQSSQGRGQGVTIRGPGVWTGGFIGRDELDVGDPELEDGFTGFTDRNAWSFYVMYYNKATGGLWTTNQLTEVTIVAQPYWLETSGFGYIESVQCIAPWYFNADGPQIYKQNFIDTGPLSVGYCYDSFFFMGDDAIKLTKYDSYLLVSGSFFVSVGNTPLSAGYFPRPTNDSLKSVLVTDCDVLAFGHGDIEKYQDAAVSVNDLAIGTRGIFRAMSEGYSGETGLNVTNYTIDNIRVWGACTQRPCIIGNIRYPFGGAGNAANQRDQQGYTDNIVMSNWTFEQPFTQKGVFTGYDEDNKPSNIVVTNWNIAGTAVTSGNYTDYFEIDSRIDDSTWDPVGTQVDLGQSTFDYTYGIGRYTPVGRASNALTSSEFFGVVTNPWITGITEIGSSVGQTTVSQGFASTATSTPATNPTTVSELTDQDVDLILNRLESVGGDVDELSPKLKSSWTQNVLENLSPEVARQILKIDISDKNTDI